MHLTPREVEKLTLHQAGFLAQKRLARGIRLNYPESVALIATQVLELIRDGKTVAQLMDLGRQMLGRKHVMSGVPELVGEVQVEGTFPDGTKLVTVHHPISAQDGDLQLALYGSFLPVPDPSLFDSCHDAQMSEPVPGDCQPKTGQIVLNQDRQTVRLTVTHLGDRPIQVGSHYHFIETNSQLKFDRAGAYGKRLDIPAGTAVRFEPGETKTVTLVEIAGRRVIRGGNHLADGPVSEQGCLLAIQHVGDKGFANETTRQKD